MELTPTSVDLSKSVFQLSIADSQHRVMQRKRLNRTQFHRWLATQKPVRLVMEACGTAHYWGRVAHSSGHEVTLLHANYVKPYVRRTKTDSADADALLQADRNPELHRIPVKSVDKQALQSLHCLREHAKSSRVASINEARALLSEFGVVIPKGDTGLLPLLREGIERVPPLLQSSLFVLIEEIERLADQQKTIDRILKNFAQSDDESQLLINVAGIGVTTATAMVARVGDIHQFKCGRSFASWLGITCREYSSGSKRRLGRITKKGDNYLRVMIIHGARSALRAAKHKDKHDKELTRVERWAVETEQRIGYNKAAVALANKMARIIWAVWTRQQKYNGNDANRFAA